MLGVEFNRATEMCTSVSPDVEGLKTSGSGTDLPWPQDARRRLVRLSHNVTA